MESLSHEVKQNILTGSSLKFAFIENVSNHKALAILISSFLNTQGGDLLIGVKPNKKINGINPDEVLSKVEYILNLYFANPIDYSFQKLIDGRHLLVIFKFPKMEDKVAVPNETNKKFYFRIEGTIFEANKIVLKTWDLIRKNANVECTKLHDDILQLFQKNEDHTLSYIYKVLKMKKSSIDISLSELIYLNKLSLVNNDDRLTYKLNR